MFRGGLRAVLRRSLFLERHVPPHSVHELANHAETKDVGFARHGNQKRTAVPVLPSGRSRKLQAIHQHLQSTYAESHLEEVAEVLLPQFAKMERRRCDKKSEQRCESMVLGLYLIEIPEKSRLVSSNGEARERFALCGSWSSVGWRYRALVMNENEPRANIDLDDVLKG